MTSRTHKYTHMLYSVFILIWLRYFHEFHIYSSLNSDRFNAWFIKVLLDDRWARTSVCRLFVSMLQFQCNCLYFRVTFNLLSIFLKWYSVFFLLKLLSPLMLEVWRRSCSMEHRLWNYIVDTMWLCRCWLSFLLTWIIMASLKMKLMQHFRFPDANREWCWENNFDIRMKCIVQNGKFQMYTIQNNVRFWLNLNINTFETP